MMTMFRNQFRKIPAAALAFALVPVVRILPVHKILEIDFPSLAVGVEGKRNIFRCIYGGTVTW